MRSFFVLSDREKATPTTHPQRETKTQRESNRRETKGMTKDKKAGKRDKKKGKHATSL